MKNLVLSFICILSVSATQAQSQLAKGEKLAGLQFNLIEGDLYYTYPTLSFGSNQSRYGLNLVPTYGVALQRNWVVGGQTTLGFISDTHDDGGGNKSITTYYDAGIAPFTRLYLDLTRNGKVKIFGMASFEFGYSSRKHKYTNGYGGTSESSTSETSLEAALGFGAAYFGNGVSVDLNISVMGLRMGFYLPYRNPAKK